MTSYICDCGYATIVELDRITHEQFTGHAMIREEEDFEDDEEFNPPSEVLK